MLGIVYDRYKEKDGYHYDRMENIFYPLVDGECPKCKSALYMHDGGEQGGIPHIECINNNCDYQKY